ncbi:MAG: YheC/YheD family protein [Bacillaceae bacterium]|nr:YheC/YheD family protein [Bacillaceae bacterium]
MHHLPETAELISQEQLQKWVKTHDEVYLKPVLSNRGKGIFLLSVEADTFVVTTNSSIYSFNNFEDLWDELNLDLICNKYIIQRKVALHTFEGSVYDYRVLVQRLRSDWTITGIGVRVAKKEGILTHIPNGGKIISIKELSDALTREEIEHLVQFVATKLERAYGYIGEFSIDIGKDKNNNLWIFEVNSKPMKFDEPDIYAKQLETLIDNFYAETFFFLNKFQSLNSH